MVVHPPQRANVTKCHGLVTLLYIPSPFVTAHAGGTAQMDTERNRAEQVMHNGGTMQTQEQP
jgi:hypothetical protein